MGFIVNASGAVKARALIVADKINRIDGWSLTDAERTALPDGGTEFYLAIDDQKEEKDPKRFLYPFGKLDGSGQPLVNLAALRMIKTKSEKAGQGQILKTVSDLLTAIVPKKQAAKEISQQNESLCGSRGEIRERLGPHALPTAVLEAASGAGTNIIGPFLAKVFHADKPNLNDRIYPIELMSVVRDKFNAKAKAKKALGAVDHPGFMGGGMKDLCLIWADDMHMDPTGAGFQSYYIVSKHSRGADLQALKENGVPLAFSLRGYGSAHYPSDAERERYHLPEDSDIVIIDENYELNFIDCVDQPAVPDAYDQTDPPSGDGKKRDSASDESSGIKPPTKQDSTENQMFKTLDECKAQAPEFYKLIEGFGAQAVADAVKPLNTKIGELQPKADALDGIVAKFNPFLDGIKDIAAIKIPTREVGTPEHTASLKTAKDDTVRVQGLLDTEKSNVTKLQGEIDGLKKVQADTQRRAAITLKVDEKLKDNKFADEIRKEIVDGKLIDNEATTPDTVAALIDTRTASFTAIESKMSGNGTYLGFVTSQPKNQNDSSTLKGGSGGDNVWGDFA